MLQDVQKGRGEDVGRRRRRVRGRPCADRLRCQSLGCR